MLCIASKRKIHVEIVFSFLVSVFYWLYSSCHSCFDYTCSCFSYPNQKLSLSQSQRISPIQRQSSISNQHIQHQKNTAHQLSRKMCASQKLSHVLFRRDSSFVSFVGTNTKENAARGECKIYFNKFFTFLYQKQFQDFHI